MPAFSASTVISHRFWITTPNIVLWAIFQIRASSPSPTHSTLRPSAASSGSTRSNTAFGPEAAYEKAKPYLDMMGVGSSYVGEGELSRIAKICHNVHLGVVIQSLCEITVLAEKVGMPRHAFLDFLNKSVMGSMFTRYKTPALVNLDFHVTFTPKLLRKDLDLGLDAGREFEVPMPLTSLTRDLLQQMIGHGLTEEDFSTLLLMQAKASGIQLKPENKEVGDGLTT